tara:strand:+ start:99 stop:581 length:483 start_codon:yes stop_codon:yes gene_type:complete
LRGIAVNFLGVVIKMKNKKGWLRIIEAVIAIMIVGTAVLYISSNKVNGGDVGSFISEKQSQIFDVITNDEDYRDEIIGIGLSNGCVKVGREDGYGFVNFINKVMPNNLDYVVNVCGIDEIGNAGLPEDREIFISESVLSSTLTNYPNEESRKIRLFMWVK